MNTLFGFNILRTRYLAPLVVFANVLLTACGGAAAPASSSPSPRQLIVPTAAPTLPTRFEIPPGCTAANLGKDKDGNEGYYLMPGRNLRDRETGATLKENLGTNAVIEWYYGLTDKPETVADCPNDP